MSDTLALLVTYHNERAWLRECIESVLLQPGSPDEILVYDDASDRLAADYIPADARIRIIRGHTNIGPARARNVLLNAAQATFVHYHDADDWFLPHWAERVRAAMRDADVVMSDVQSNQPHVMNTRSLAPALTRSGDELLPFAIRGSVLVPSLTYRRELALAAGGWNEELHQSEDWEFHIRLFARKPRVRVIAEDLVAIRVHDAQRSRDVADVWNSAVRAIVLLAPTVPPEYHADLAAAAVRAGRILFREGDTGGARRAFSLGKELSLEPYTPFDDPRMRGLSRLLGPVGAERVARLYRGLRARLKLLRINAS